MTNAGHSLVSGQYPAVPPDQLAALDKIDSEQRKLAQRSGRTHVIATLPARTAQGKIVGRASAAGYG